MKYYIIAGERSGDIHASNLMKEIKKLDANWEFRCCGGDLMQKEGGTLVIHNKELSFMGFLEVALKFGKVLHLLKVCKRDIINYKPDVLILVDFAGFNLRIAKFVKKQKAWGREHGIVQVFYYISPKVWAWNQSRVYKIKKLVDRMFVILPFEKEFYKRFDYEVDYVGNPTLYAVLNHKINHNFRKNNQLDKKPILAILPGSRKQEIKKMLRFVTSISKAFSDYNIVVAAVSNLYDTYYDIQLRKINEKFNCDLKKYKIGDLKTGTMLYLGKPCNILKNASIPNLNIVLTQSVIRRKTEKHDYSINKLKDLPIYINDPIMIFSSQTREDAKVILTEIKQKGKNFVVAIQLSKTRINIQINDIRSIHRRQNDQIFNWIEKGSIIYINEKKSLKWLQAAKGVHFPQGVTIKDFTVNIRKKLPKVQINDKKVIVSEDFPIYEMASKHSAPKIVYDQTYDLLAHSDAALVTSGTATLETSLFEVPHVVCYKTSRITALIIRLLIKVKYISLENLISGKQVVKELIQQDFNLRNIIYELKQVLFNQECRNIQIKEFKKIASKLGKNDASAKAASLMVEYLKSSKYPRSELDVCN